jgi:hypothetical protein
LHPVIHLRVEALPQLRAICREHGGANAWFGGGQSQTATTAKGLNPSNELQGRRRQLTSKNGRQT